MPMSSQRIILFVISVAGLFAVRYFERDLFYDPLKLFFNGAYQSEGLPEISWGRWFLSALGRFLLNTLLSLAILQAIFKKTTLIQFSAMLYLVLFFILLPSLLLLAHYYIPGDYRALFYVRRFLIHPVLLLLLIPSFLVFYPKKNT